MKINRLETHDRLLQFKKQADHISKGCQDCIDTRPKEFMRLPFYIFAHKREISMDERFTLVIDGVYDCITKVPTHRLIWQPRLTKPEAQENSMLFKYYPGLDLIYVIWMIPDPALWDQYSKGKISENESVCESIALFKTDKKKLESPMDDDISEEKVKSIYQEIAKNAQKKKTTKAV